MSPQADFIVSNGTGAAVRSDLNVQFAAIVSNNSGATEPATMYAYQWWANTTTGLLLIRNAANSAWVTVGTLADANLGLLSLGGGTMTGALLADDSGTAALPAISFDGDSDTGIFRAGANELAVATNGTQRITIDSSGRLLVGSSSAPSAGSSNQFGKLVVQGNTFSASTASVLSLNRGEGAASITSGEEIGIVVFGDSAGNEFGSIQCVADAAAGSGDYPGRLTFSVTADGAGGTTEAMRINNQRELLVGTATRNANGGVLQLKSGITFPATAVAAADVNTLDDYEEGTWTPVFNTSTPPTTPFGNYTDGATYVKIGKVVYIAGMFRTNGVTIAGAAGNVIVTGLPFASTGFSGSICVSQAGGWNSNTPRGGYVTSSQINLTSTPTATGGTTLTAYTDLTTGVGLANLIQIFGFYSIS